MSNIIEYTISDLCVLIKIALDERDFNKAQYLLTQIQIIQNSHD